MNWIQLTSLLSVSSPPFPFPVGMISIQLSLPVAILVAALGALWIYQDAKKRRMDTADMWAVGFVVGFFVLPIIGGIAVFLYYIHRRGGRGPDPTMEAQRRT